MVKQVIVVRKDLDMPCGKLAGQVAHASLAPVLEKMRQGVPYEVLEGNSEEEHRLFLDLKNGDPMKEWIDGIFTKVIAEVSSEEKLVNLHDKLRKAGITACLIKDIGKTVFGKPTITCLGIEPLDAEKIDPFTKRLRLVK